MNTKSFGVWFCLCLLHSSCALAQIFPGEGGGEATYDPRTGRIVVQVERALNWFIQSHSRQLTGPDDPVASGVLPAAPLYPENSLVTNTDEVIGEASSVRDFSYGPLDLGRVAQPNLPPGDLWLLCECPFNNGAIVTPVRYIPEPATLGLVCVAALFAFKLRSRKGAAAIEFE